MGEQIYFDADMLGAPEHFDERRFPLRGRLLMQINGRIGQSLYYDVGFFPTYEEAKQIADSLNKSVYGLLYERVIIAAQAYGRYQAREHVKPEYSPGSQRDEGFHWREGWFFERQPDGGVLVTQSNLNIALTIPVAEWASIVASMSAAGENAETFKVALDAQRPKETPNAE